MDITRSLCLAFLVLLATASCTAARKPSTTESSLPLLPGDSNVVHAVRSAELREAMRGLEEIATQRLPDRIDEKAHRQSELREVARLADELARGAAEIPDSLGENPLPSADERRFRELAEQLVRDSFALRDRAILGEVGSVREETEQLLATCNACHAMARLTPMAHAEAAPSRR
jgi:cytochrome c556